ncbi:MAG: tetratricopeptide repeat protein [Deltaproteobacteria bacterium]|nr:tetratricopeptide repeat protein [Deltaproteobacteria bacterium]
MASDQVKRKLTTILSADVKGYSRLMGEDEELTLRTLNSHKEMMGSLIQQHQGRVVGTAGDSVLAEFASVVDAVQCAVEIQQMLRAKNAVLPETRRMEFRIGINLGDVIEEGDSIYGDGVNIAARLEGLAEPGGICISESAFQQIENKIPLQYDYLGEHEVKNIAKPVRVYRARIEPEVISSPILEEKKPERKKLSRTVLAGIALVVFAAAAGLYLFVLRPSAPKTEVALIEKMAYSLPDKPSIAVLPFTNLSGDPKQEFFSDGITEDIITALSKIQKLFVIARNSTFAYKGKPVKIKQVSEELGVRYVLEGSVQRSGGRVRITAQLIDALSGHHIWSERYDRELKDLFTIQDEVTLRILSALQVKLTEGEQASLTVEKFLKEKQGLDLYFKVYEAYQYLRMGSIDDTEKIRQIAEEIVAKWPESPWGYIFMGWTYYSDLWAGSTKNPRESLEKGLGFSKKALAMDDSSPTVHALLSHFYVYIGNHDKAIAEGERAVAIVPNGATALHALGQSLLWAGQLNEAILIFQKSIRLNPHVMGPTRTLLGFAYLLNGQFEEAVTALKQALVSSPNFIYTHINLASAYMALGKEKEARAEAAEVLRLNAKFSLDTFAKTNANFKNQSLLNGYFVNLRKAGLK